jgi:hypothetical protein
LAEIVAEPLLVSSELLVPPVPDVPVVEPSIGDAAAPFSACPAVIA